MALILCTGVHPALMETRKLILEQAGHTVITAMSSPELVASCQNFKIDVAVIGQSLDQDTKQEWAALIREYRPDIRMLEVFLPGMGIAIQDADDWLESPTMPHNIVERIDALMAKNKQAAG